MNVDVARDCEFLHASPRSPDGGIRWLASKAGSGRVGVNRANAPYNSLFLEKFSLIHVRKFPVPLRREFGGKPLNLLAC
jgi:hypothetical protein